MAKMEEEIAVATIETPTKARLLNRERSSIGSVERFSLRKKMIMRTTAPTMKLTVVALDHPSSLPRTSANTRRKRLAENEMNPTQSTLRERTSFDLAMRVRVTKMATTPMGTLTKKIHRHPM